MELSAIRREFPKVGDESCIDFIRLLEAYDKFREFAELAELEIREDRWGNIEDRIGGKVCDAAREILVALFESESLRGYVIEAVLRNYTYDEVRTLVDRAEKAENDRQESFHAELDDHPF